MNNILHYTLYNIEGYDNIINDNKQSYNNVFNNKTKINKLIKNVKDKYSISENMNINNEQIIQMGADYINIMQQERFMIALSGITLSTLVVALYYL